MASRELRATQGPEEEEVGSLERVCTRFAPNFGQGPGIELPNAREDGAPQGVGATGRV
ncbi:MAG: hypothetical protein QOD01_79 [Actinomycetota bacterium]|jgi:hypothetical protein|nr:hypothetical protein [Actinomycetota bacterium]